MKVQHNIENHLSNAYTVHVGCCIQMGSPFPDKFLSLPSWHTIIKNIFYNLYFLYVHVNIKIKSEYEEIKESVSNLSYSQNKSVSFEVATDREFNFFWNKHLYATHDVERAHA